MTIAYMPMHLQLHSDRIKRYTRRAMRMTIQRRAILDALRRVQRPLTPKEILEEASAEAEDLSLTTVYRNLKALTASGALTVVEVFGQPPRYELAGLDHHHHFLCQVCDRLFDVEGCPGTLASMAPPGFAVLGHSVLLTGQCAECGESS